MLRAVALAVLLPLLAVGGEQPKAPPPAKKKAAPKKKREPLVIPDVARDKVICFCLYTVHNRTLKLSAQLYPLRDGEERKVALEIERDGRWQPAAAADVNPEGWLATFRVEG